MRFQSGSSIGLLRPPPEVTASLPGTYAVIAAHDENGNGELEPNFLGIPQEGVGTSGKARKGPPRWKDAKFDVPGTTTISIVMNYF